jgi:hypothetical protein
MPPAATTWSRAFGSAFDDRLTALTVDATDHIAVTGYFSDTIDAGGGPLVCESLPGNDPNTLKDIFVARYAANGAHIWSRRIGSTADADRGYAIASAPNGDVVVAGTVGAYTDFGDGRLSQFYGAGDAFVARYAAADGALRWYHLVGSNSASDVASAVTVDSSDNTIVAGTFAGTGNFNDGDPVIPSVGNVTSVGGSRDVFVAKYGPSGAFQYVRRQGGSSDESVNAVAADAAGNVRITGKYIGTTTFTKSAGSIDLAPGSSSYRTYVTELDPSGNAIWAKAYGSAASIDSGSLASAADGSVTVVGTFQGTNVDFDGVTRSAVGGRDAFVMKLAPNGARMWINTFGTSSDESAPGVALDAAGSAIVVGSFSASLNFGGGSIAPTATDVYVAGYAAATGAFKFAHKYGAGFNQYGVTVGAASSGKVAVGGYFVGTIDLGTGPKTTVGNNDGFVGTVTP